MYVGESRNRRYEAKLTVQCRISTGSQMTGEKYLYRLYVHLFLTFWLFLPCRTWKLQYQRLKIICNQQVI